MCRQSTKLAHGCSYEEQLAVSPKQPMSGLSVKGMAHILRRFNILSKYHLRLRTDLLSIIRSLNTVFTTIGICHTSYVACLRAR